MIGAKKLTWKTSRQTCIGVSIEFMRLPSFSFGEMPALLTSAFSWPPCASSRWRISETAMPTSSGSGKIDLDVVFRAGRPWAILGERLARTGDDPPALARKALDRGVADAAAGAGQHDRLAGVGLCHALPPAPPCSGTAVALRGRRRRPSRRCIIRKVAPIPKDLVNQRIRAGGNSRNGIPVYGFPDSTSRIEPCGARSGRRRRPAAPAGGSTRSAVAGGVSKRPSASTGWPARGWQSAARAKPAAAADGQPGARARPAGQTAHAARAAPLRARREDQSPTRRRRHGGFRLRLRLQSPGSWPPARPHARRP